MKRLCFVCKQYDGTFCELSVSPVKLPCPSPQPSLKLSRTGCCCAPTRADHTVLLLPGVPPWEIHPLALILCLVCNVCEVEIYPCCSVGCKTSAVLSSGRWLVVWWARIRIMCKNCLVNICQNRRINCILGQALLLFTLCTRLTNDLPWSLLWICVCCTVFKRIKDRTGHAQHSFLHTVFSVAILQS